MRVGRAGQPAPRHSRALAPHARCRRPSPSPHPPCYVHVQVYAVYGCFFIVLSYLWGWAVDGVQPDTGGRR